MTFTVYFVDVYLGVRFARLAPIARLAPCQARQDSWPNETTRTLG